MCLQRHLYGHSQQPNVKWDVFVFGLVQRREVDE